MAAIAPLHAIALTLALAGCSDEPAGVDAAKAELGLPFRGGDLGAGTDAADTALTTADAQDGTADLALNCPGAAHCPCQSNADCAYNVCIDTAAGKLCAQPCVENCPTGFACGTYVQGVGDPVSVCLPRWPRLCDPCSTDSDCQANGSPDGVCTDQMPLGRFCATPCKSGSDCPAGYNCATQKTATGKLFDLCVRAPDPGTTTPGTCSCSKSAVAKQLQTACGKELKDATGKVIGACPGVRVCGPDGLGACTAPSAVPETCNGLDDDCNGLTDDLACDDKNPCTQDLCKPGGGSCTATALDGLSCDADGNACTVSDTCQQGVCAAGKVKNCDDANACTVDGCDPVKGCTQKPDDGNPCSDENACTVGDLCQGGTCKAGAAKSCPGGSVCSEATCDVATAKCALQPKPEGTACDDGSPCTSNDACKAGTCQGAGTNCDDGNPCTLDTCAAGGKCSATPVGAGGACGQDDGNPCTDQACDASGGCVTTTNSKPCDDANPCTAGDTCGGGACKPGKAACNPGDPCKQDSDCNGGVCLNGKCSKPAVSCGPAGTTSSGALGTLVIDQDATVDTDTGVVTVGGKAIGPQDTQLVAQAGSAPKVRVFPFQSLTVAAGKTLKATGSHALALLTTGDLAVDGRIDAAGTPGGSGTVNAAGAAGKAGPGGWDGGQYVAGQGCSGNNGNSKGPGMAVAGPCGGPGTKGGQGSSGGGGGGGGGGCGGGGGGGGGHAAQGSNGSAGAEASDGQVGAGAGAGTGSAGCFAGPDGASGGAPSGDSTLSTLWGGSGGSAGGFGGFAGFGGAGGPSGGSGGAGGTPGFSGGGGGGGGGGGAVLLCAGAKLSVSFGGEVDVSGGYGGVGSGSGLAGTGGNAPVFGNTMAGGGGGSGRSGAGGGGGGGAAGSVLLIGASVQAQGSIKAVGGKGGQPGGAFGSGGFGGNGKLGGGKGGTGGNGGAGGAGGAGSGGVVKVKG
jgi:hypothetical protein